MALDDVGDVTIDSSPEAFQEDSQKKDIVQEYSFDCPNCDNSMEKVTSGNYYPKTHLCQECMSWLWVWVDGGKIYEDELTVKEI